jgi:hypothetical protein
MRRFQFSIRGMLIFTAAIAIGFALGKTTKVEDGLFAFASTWIVAGLIAQIVDLRAVFRQASGLTRDQSCAWWFAILSRTGLATLVVGHFLLIALLATKRLTLTGVEGDFPWEETLFHESLRNAIFALSLFLVFAGLDIGKRSARPRRWTPVVNAAMAFAVVIMVCYSLIDRFVVASYGHFGSARVAIEMPHAHAPYAKVFSDARSLSFLNLAMLASGIVLLDVLLLYWLTRCWTVGRLRRAVALLALGIGLALTAIYPAWLATGGLRETSPFCAELLTIQPLNRWLFGAVLAIMFVTAGARRIIPAEQLRTNNPQSTWRRRSALYYNEYRLLAVFVAIAIVCMEFHRPFPTVYHLSYVDFETLSWTYIWYPKAWKFILMQLLQDWPCDPRLQLWLLVLFVAIYRAIFGFARAVESPGSLPRELPLTLYITVWIALMAIVIIAVPIFAALGFGLALNWWRFPF